MDNISEIAKQKIAELKLSIHSCRQEIEALREREKSQVEQFNAWLVILKSLKSQDQDNAIHNLSIEQMSAGHAAGRRVFFSHSGALPEESGDKYGLKIAMARAVLEVAAEKGLAPKELKEQLEEGGMTVGPSFASNTLSRMKESGEVFEREGRYFWTGKSRYSIEIKQLEPVESFAEFAERDIAKEQKEKEATEEAS